MKLIIVMVFGGVLLAPQAQALSIKNLSGAKQTVVIEQAGQHIEIPIAANQTRYLSGGDVQIALKGKRFVQTKNEEEYTIWPDGSLIIQRINKARSGSR
ncbi:MAG: hypothetical protein MK052_03585 [Alphaproteobacteria bacterium]|nr:hypothetical protein [Alphaproteobacteria bacterium]